ncbi:MAG: NTP transferase domain-containing protein [Planctomycetes bacterium]|nr:NTP transferase domain-containing protein [Planctomycetota bacterium]
MGRPKALLPLGGSTFAGTLLAALAEAGYAPLLAVVRPLDAPVRLALESAGARVLENPDPGRGMLSSLLLAVEAAAADPAVVGLAVCPVDCPRVAARTLAALREALLAGRGEARALVPRHAGRRGHPALFPRGLFEALRLASPGVGAREVTRTALELEVDDPTVLDDFDRPGDLS